MKSFHYNTTLTDKFSSFFESSQRVAILSHTNPDGDAVGSALALTRFLSSLAPEKDIRPIVPNHFPSFLRFVDHKNEIYVANDQLNEVQAFLAAADLIICVDFNQPHRLDALSDALAMNFDAKRVLIDHHIDPPQSFDLMFHSTQSSSTALLVYNLIVDLKGVEAIDENIAEPLYLGMMTDTGGFSFSTLNAELFRAVANVVERGADPVKIHREVFDTQTESRVRLVGYLLDNKMVVIPEKMAAYITLTQEEKDKFKFQIGDSEGVVNMPLTIKNVEFSAILIENKDMIKLSLRSQGDRIDVNAIAREHFNGGGHKNAAGGRLMMSMEQAVEKVKQVIETL